MDILWRLRLYEGAAHQYGRAPNFEPKFRGWSVGVTGVILSKLDSSARGGMAFAIQNELKWPILFVGLGEKPEDLIPFDPDAFVDGILANQ